MPDTIDRLTPLGVMVLALLEEGDMHPYEMMRLLRQRRDDRFVTVTNGTLYHTVGRLERAGLLAEVGIDRNGNRPERTTYTLTGDGRAGATAWVRRELGRIDRPDQFRVALAEAHNLDRDEVLALLRERRALLAGALAALRDGHADAVGRGVPEQFLVEVERELTLAGAELDWLDELLARLDSHAFAWGAHELTHRSDRYLLDRKAARL